jgi:hypothetical protein
MTYLTFFNSEAAAKAFSHYVYLTNIVSDEQGPTRYEFPIVKHATQELWALQVTDTNKLSGLDMLNLQQKTQAELEAEGWFAYPEET